MAEEEETREVLFPQWMGADKHGLTIEKSGEGEIFVKDVKDESPAAHTGKVHKGKKSMHALRLKKKLYVNNLQHWVLSYPHSHFNFVFFPKEGLGKNKFRKRIQKDLLNISKHLNLETL